jgi:ectoine hydroxylase-related dioxygenase (phytanoyl-CoA dioxygenase family)
MECIPKDFSRREHFLWTDIPDAASRLSGLVQNHETQDPLRRWVDGGYAILQSAVNQELATTFIADIQSRLIDTNTSIHMTFWDDKGHHVEPAHLSKLSFTEAKVLDLHAHLESAQRLVFSAKILDMLRLIFDDEVVAFQSLYFEFGSGQGAHQDTAFVLTEPPMHFAASTIALEDVSAGQGELFFYPGSQKLGDFIFAGGGKAFSPDDPDCDRYSEVLETAADASGLRRTPFLPATGDALLWAADLIHGGEPHAHLRTRRSLVTHYCPRGASVPYVRHSGLEPRQIGPGAWVVGQYGP